MGATVRRICIPVILSSVFGYCACSRHTQTAQPLAPVASSPAESAVPALSWISWRMPRPGVTRVLLVRSSGGVLLSVEYRSEKGNQGSLGRPIPLAEWDETVAAVSAVMTRLEASASCDSSEESLELGQDKSVESRKIGGCQHPEIVSAREKLNDIVTRHCPDLEGRL